MMRISPLIPVIIRSVYVLPLCIACVSGPAVVKGNPPKPMGSESGVLDGTRWILKAIEHREMIETAQLTLEFGTDGRVSGHSGCNRFMGGYIETGNRLAFEEFASTRMACDPPLMELEARYLDALRRVQRWQIDAAGSLLLHDAENAAALTFLPHKIE